MRLHQKTNREKDGMPAALYCYGMLQTDHGQMWLRFVTGQVNGKTTLAYLAWLAESLASTGHTHLLLIWDWHKSKMVKQGLKAHNQATRLERKTGKVALTLVPCWLLAQSPCDSPIEPKWLHGKRAVVEPERKLPVAELTERVCAY